MEVEELEVEEIEIFDTVQEIQLSELGILLYEYPVWDGILEDPEIDLVDRVLWEEYPIFRY